MTKRIIIVIIVVFSFQCVIQLTFAETEFRQKLTGEPISVIKCSFVKTAYFWIGEKQDKSGLDIIYKIKCFVKKIYSGAYYFITGDRNTELETKNEDYSFIISDLNTDIPKLKGNIGESQLHILKRTPDTIYLSEVTPAGNALNHITLFFRKGIVIYSKQYQMFPPDKGEITAYMSVGHFE